MPTFQGPLPMAPRDQVSGPGFHLKPVDSRADGFPLPPQSVFSGQKTH